jgi:DNA mismatch endonuclease (patch repair protein)
MAGIAGKDTQPELFVRRHLHAQGFRYRLHMRSLPGCPDIVLPRWGICIFVNGCFWHAHRGCAYARRPSTNASRWEEKFSRNRARDKQVRAALRALGWRVVDIWECGIKDVSSPDLSWLGPEIEQGRKMRVQWPARPRKRTPDAPRVTR